MSIRRLELLACAAFVALLLHSSVSAQEAGPSSQFERVKGLAPFRGIWTSEAGGEGSAGGFRIASNWSANRSYLQMQFTTSEGDERTHLGTVTIGWSAADNGLTSWAFWPDYQSKGKVSIDGKTLHVKPAGTTVDGQQMSADVTMTVDGDTMTLKVTDSRRGDDTQPDVDVTLKRRERRRRQRASE